MTYEFLLLTIFGLATYSFFLSRKKAMALNVMDPSAVHSQPHYHGLYSAMLTITPAIILLLIWSWFENSIFKDNLEKYFSDVKYELEDDFLSEDDAISKFEEVLEDNNLLDIADKMQRVDDRMTELVAGYRLEVQLVKEDF